jgi:RHS repeat-associated protein
MLTYLTVDHLGAPILASSNTATAAWSGGFEPFGRDFTTPSAQSSGIFLRLPGQWDDIAWNKTQLDSGLYYNVSRWYDPTVGRYATPDNYHASTNLSLTPGLGRLPSRAPLAEVTGTNLYEYSLNNPVDLVDPDGRSPQQWTPTGNGWEEKRCEGAALWACEAMCEPQPIERCVEYRAFRPTRHKGGLVSWDWVEGGIDCKCRQDILWPLERCLKNLSKNLQDIGRWLADHPPVGIPGGVPGFPPNPVLVPP